MNTSEHKALPVNGFKVLSDTEGVVEAIVSVTGVVDEVRDIIEPGAYSKTIAQRLPKGCWNHDWNNPVARTLSAEELLPGDRRLPKQTKDGKPWPREAGAVVVTAQFNLDTQAGREAYSNVTFFGGDQEWSIGYNVPRGGATVEAKTGIRRIQTLDWYEYSPVLFGAMPEAVTRSIKARAAAWEKATKAEAATCDGCLGDAKATCLAQRVCVHTGRPVQVKALPGSLESLREALSEAATTAMRGHLGDDSYATIHSTLADTVVVTVWDSAPGGGDRHYVLPYTVTDSGVTLGTPTPVDLMETIVPAAAEPEPEPEPVTEDTLEEKGLTPGDLLAQETFRNYLS